MIATAMKHASVDKAKRVSSGCRNHGSCPWCRRSRTIGQAKLDQYPMYGSRYDQIDPRPFSVKLAEAYRG